MPEPGGLMIFGIPEYRVPKKNVRAGVKELIELKALIMVNQPRHRSGT